MELAVSDVVALPYIEGTNTCPRCGQKMHPPTEAQDEAISDWYYEEPCQSSLYSIYVCDCGAWGYFEIS